MMKGFGSWRRSCQIGALLLVQLLALCCFAPAVTPPAPSVSPVARGSALHKIQVNDPLLARKIEAHGGRLIADYGSFKLYEVSNLPPGLLANTRAEMRDGYDVIQLHAGHLNTRKPEVRALSQSLGKFSGKRLHLVQFAGPVQAQWRDQLLAAGVQIISYIPENTYLIYGDAQSLAAVQKLTVNPPHIQWEGAYRDDYKVHPQARPADAKGRPRHIGTDLFDIQLVDDAAANGNTLKLLDKLKLAPFQRQETNHHHLNLIVRLNPKDLAKLSAQPEIISILPYFPRQKFCERQDQIIAGNLTNGVPTGPGYLAWLTNLGFTPQQFVTSGFVVDITDSGVDNGTTSPTHFGLYTGGNLTNASRIIYNRYERTVSYSTNSLEGCDGHGNLNAHIIGGYVDFSGFPFADAAGYHYGLGVCPFVNLGSSVIFNSAASDSYYYPNFNNLQAEAYRDGARISCNSWGGANSQGIYDSEAQKYDALVRDAQPTNSTVPMDGNQPMIIVFAAGNDGSSGQSIDTPGTAKNIISVGAADNVQLFGGTDRSGVSDSSASSADELASFSSRGPCADGRMKPDLVAPGTHVSGGVMQATNDFINYPNGIADSCYNGSDVSGGPNTIFWPTNQQFYTASSGTSHSTPCVAGGCALLMQYFLNNFTNAPSPAMAKAYLMNSARYLAGATANDTLPSPGQGMGEMNLGTAFDGTVRILSDQEPSNLFTNSGQSRSFTGFVTDTNRPFRITLAWTDAPGGTSGNAWNNNLDLSVTIGGTTYKGNVFNGAYSTNGGSADTKNNAESVFLPAGVSGDFVVTVTATSINSVGVPNTNNLACQDFALVIYNATAEARAVMTSAGTTLSSESCQPTNGVIDPGETVTVNFVLQNLGTAATTNLVATLLTNSSVLSSSAPQTYGAVLPGLAASEPFTFHASGTCGGTITASLHLQDGAEDLGIINFTFNLGQFVAATSFVENFDGATTPALPAGWTNNFFDAESRWVTTTNLFASASNSVYAAEPDQPGLTQLFSPIIPIASATAQLSFMNNFDLESYPSESSTPTTAFDGGVLEISIAGGEFQDILAAGGSFVTGGYLASVYSPENPLHDRLAWCGNSGGFISTVVNLPAAAAGQNIQLRWACGTDSGNSSGGTGWYIDSISISDGYYTCCSTPPTAPTIQNAQIIGTNLVFTFPSLIGQSYSVQSATNLASHNWITIQTLTGNGTTVSITNDATAPKKYYRIISP